MTVEEAGNNVIDLISQIEIPFEHNSKLRSLLYTLGEAGLFPDYVDSVSEEQAILIWRVVEFVVRSKGELPERELI